GRGRGGGAGARRGRWLTRPGPPRDVGPAAGVPHAARGPASPGTRGQPDGGVVGRAGHAAGTHGRRAPPGRHVSPRRQVPGGCRGCPGRAPPAPPRLRRPRPCPPGPTQRPPLSPDPPPPNPATPPPRTPP